MRILIVDVDGNSNATVESLRKDGHEIVVCRTGEEALHKLEARQADLVVVGRPDNVLKFRGGTGARPAAGADHGRGQAGNVIPLHQSTPGSSGPLPDCTPWLGVRGLTDILEEIESRLVDVAMERTGHNQIKASELLRITRGALQYKLKKYIKPQAA